MIKTETMCGVGRSSHWHDAAGGIALGWHAAIGGVTAAHELALGGASLAKHARCAGIFLRVIAGSILPNPAPQLVLDALLRAGAFAEAGLELVASKNTETLNPELSYSCHAQIGLGQPTSKLAAQMPEVGSKIFRCAFAAGCAKIANDWSI